MRKSSFTTALAFFMEKSRAKTIEKEEKIKATVSNANIIDYSGILTKHLQTQAKKLRNAFVSCHGWKVVLNSQENADQLTLANYHFSFQDQMLLPLQAL